MEAPATLRFESFKKRITIRFKTAPKEELSFYLQELGFKTSKSIPLEFYAHDQPAYKYFAETLIGVLKEGKDYKSIPIKASHSPKLERIKHRKFSHVTLEFHKDGEPTSKDYVIFDQHKGIANVMADQYIKTHFGSRPVVKEVSPKENKIEAKEAFKQGDIIGGDTYVGAPELVKPAALSHTNNSNESEPVPSLKNEHGVYTKETAGDHFETLDIPIPKAAKYSARISIVKDESALFRYGVSQHKEFGDATGSASPVSDISKQYPTKEEAIKQGLKEIVTTIKKLIEARDSIVSNQAQKNKQLQKALDAVLEFGVSYGIDLDDPETVTKNAIKTTTVIQTEKPEEDTEEEQPKQKTYTIKESWSSVDLKLIEKLEDFVETYPEYLHLSYSTSSEDDEKGTSATPYGARLISDRDTISFQLRHKDQLHISAHLPKDENVNYGASTMSKNKLTKAIKYMLSKPDSLELPKAATAEDIVTSEVTSQESILLPTGETATTPTPKAPELKAVPSHLLIPEGVAPAFAAKRTMLKDAAWLKMQFKELFTLTNDTLSSATPPQLFMLMQLPHPTDYGIKVDRSKLLDYWEKHGKELFEKLGYSTHSDALYGNGIVDFIGVSRLEDILNKNGAPNWYYVIENYRFIKDYSAAIQFLKTEKAAIKKELEAKAYLKKGFEYAAAYNEDLQWKISTMEESIALLKKSTKEKKRAAKPKSKETKTATPSKCYVPSSLVKTYVFFSQESAAQIRIALKEKRLPMPFTGKQAWEADCTPLELLNRWGTTWDAFENIYQEPLQFQIANREKTLLDLKRKRTKTARDKREELNEYVTSDKKKLTNIESLVHDEFLVFQDELFEVVLEQAKNENYKLKPDAIADFQEEIMPQLLEEHRIELYANEPIQRLLPKLLKWYFEDGDKPHALPKRSPLDDERQTPDYMAKVIAYMSDAYMEAQHLTKKKVENLMEVTGTPNIGMLWEAVELSWLLWYKMYYDERIVFENRLVAMIRFWNNVQPTYAYSDSSKELYKQYSTPCPIGAMIAQYTQMDTATSIFEPSAGNGLLLVGANPQKCHVNEIDRSRRQSLLQQDFAKVTHLNGAAPFPEQMTRSFDVVVTNPPFARWEDDKFDKTVIVKKYFDKHYGLEHHIRLEHMMAGLALHTMKSNGKAAIIIMGHTYFDERGYIVRYRPFFNWLYRNYRVADVININSYKMYNKQGAVKEVMLILIDGRKKKAKGVAPQFKDTPHLGDIENSFEELWFRIKSNIKTPLQNLIQQLKIALGHDIF